MLRDPTIIKVKKEPRTKLLKLTNHELKHLMMALTICEEDGYTCLYCWKKYLIDIDYDNMNHEENINKIEHKNSCIVNKLKEL